MAFYDLSRPRAAGSITRAVLNLITEVRAWNDVRQTRRALGKLSDHELADIGLLRSDLDTMSPLELHRL